MQFNYNRISAKTSIKKTIIKFFLLASTLLFTLFLLSKINFPAPEQEIKKKITNEIMKLK